MLCYKNAIVLLVSDTRQQLNSTKNDDRQKKEEKKTISSVFFTHQVIFCLHFGNFVANDEWLCDPLHLLTAFSSLPCLTDEIMLKLCWHLQLQVCKCAELCTGAPDLIVIALGALSSFGTSRSSKEKGSTETPSYETLPEEMSSWYSNHCSVNLHTINFHL